MYKSRLFTITDTINEDINNFVDCLGCDDNDVVLECNDFTMRMWLKYTEISLKENITDKEPLYLNENKSGLIGKYQGYTVRSNNSLDDGTISICLKK